MKITRRKSIVELGVGLAAQFTMTSSILGFASPANATDSLPPTLGPGTAELWITELQQRDIGQPLYLSRFIEPMYFLIKPTDWKSGPKLSKLPPVIVPAGFVTDFASIPKVFWSALKPDGEYAHAAVFHDYLYWTQSGSKEDADLTLKYAMEDLELGKLTVDAIYMAVHLAGQSSWDKNAKLKAAGEKRVLKVFPTKAATRWTDWKKDPNVFV
jgi:hypothetical protein